MKEKDLQRKEVLLDREIALLTERSEHRCIHCHKLFWIERHPETVRQTLERSGSFFFLTAFIYMFLVEVFFKLSLTQISGMGGILLFSAYPISWSFLKQMSSELKSNGAEYERV